MIESPVISLPEKKEISAYVRLAHNNDEIQEAQRLRYAVFYEEYGAKPDDTMLQQRRDFDSYDEITDHLVVVTRDNSTDKEKIVGTYRLLRQDVIKKLDRQFYSSEEYDLSRLIASGNNLLELGRSCVLAEYRTKPILNLLWQGIANYITDHNIDILFGCASFQGIDLDKLAPQLSYLHHYHPAPADIKPVALQGQYVNMDIIPKEELDERRVFASLPPLIKGYLRLGATIGDGAVVDEQFNTTDVCIVVQTSLMTDRYRKYYERRIQKAMPGQK